MRSDGQTYVGLAEAGQKNGVTDQRIWKSINLNRPVNGYTFSWAEDK